MSALKIVMIGDDEVGKTSFFWNLEGKEIEKSKPEVVENFNRSLLVDDLHVSLNIWLTLSNTGDSEKFRPLTYNDANIIMICFAVDDPSSFENAKIKWNKEIESEADRCANGWMKVLIGLKIDLRNDQEAIMRVKEEHYLQNLYTAMEGREMARSLGCCYVECSAMTGEGINDVFKEIIRLYYNRGMSLTSSELAYIITKKQTQFSNFTSKKWNRNKKCVFIGDNFSGKSALVGAIMGSPFKTTHHDNEELSVAEWKLWDITNTSVEEIPKFQIWDAPTGKEGYSEYSSTVRKICYTFCDAVVIVFALDEPSALERVKKKWIPEILKNVSGFIIDEREKTFCSHRYVRFVPIFLVGTKVDFRDEFVAKKNQDHNITIEEEEEEEEGEDFFDGKFVSTEQGEKFAKEMNLFVKMKQSQERNTMIDGREEEEEEEENPTYNFHHTYLECSGKTRKGVATLISKLNELLFDERPGDGGDSASTTPSTPLASSNFIENKRSKVFKLREGLRRREKWKWKMISKMSDLVDKKHFSKKQRQKHRSDTPGSGGGGTLISKLRRDVEKIEESEKVQNKKIMKQMLEEMGSEIKIARITVMNKKKECNVFLTPLRMKVFVKAYMGFKRLNQSRLSILRSNFVQRQKRWNTSDMTELQSQFDQNTYQDILDEITTSPGLPSSSLSSLRIRNRMMKGILKVEGRGLVSVQTFNFESDKSMIYFGECVVLNNNNGKKIPFGEGYVYKAYGKGFKKKLTFGLIFKGFFDENGIRTRKGVEVDLKTGKTVYEGQYNQGVREGIGVEYDLKKFQCRKGVWKDGKLVEEERCFEFGMISFGELESQIIPRNELGRGGNATVYEVMWKGSPRAAKIMRIPAGNQNLSYNVILRSVRNNLSLLAPLNHRNIIKLFGMIVGKKKVGYLMEKCLCDVNSMIVKEKGKISFKEKIRLLFETAQGNLFLHQKEIMNRDLKWSNVLLDETRRVVLTDLDTAREDETLWRNNVQNTCSSIGTPVFIAPELSGSRKYDKRIDVYSFGIMIFSLIFELVNPFSETLECPGCKCKIPTLNSYAFPTHVKNCNLRPLVDFQKQNSLEDDEKWILDLMYCCWETNPSKRPSFEEIVFILRSKLNHLEDKILRVVVKGSSSRAAGEGRRRRRRRRRRVPHHQEKIILMRKSYQSLESKIQSRWPKSKIVNILIHDSKKGYPINLDIKKQQKNHGRSNTFDFEKKIMEEEDPLIIVEFDKIPMDDDLVCLEDLVGKLKDERLERKLMEEKYEDVLKENIALKELIQTMKKKMNDINMELLKK